MSGALIRLTEAEWVAKNRDEYAVRDKSYRRYELGQEVGRFIRTMRTERKAKATRDSYEFVLRLLVLDHRDLSVKDFEGGHGIDLLYDFLDRHLVRGRAGNGECQDRGDSPVLPVGRGHRSDHQESRAQDSAAAALEAIQAPRSFAR